MPPSGSTQVLLSPAELSYLHSSLATTPPTRPDLRSPTQFRPLIAETGILPSTNGSARVCFSDGTEALVGVKAELEKTPRRWGAGGKDDDSEDDDSDDDDDDDDDAQMEDSISTESPKDSARTDPSWLEVTLDLPGHREDDTLPTFLGAMLTESLLASSATLTPRLRLNSRWHWKLYVDLLLLSAPLSYPLPLLSMATHLALANAVLPKRTSDPEDDPIFDDDWEAGARLFEKGARPPVTLLVVTVGDNIVFDPSKEELAVAESVVAVSLGANDGNDLGLHVVGIRTIDPPSRLTPLGVPNSAMQTQDTGAPGAPETEAKKVVNREEMTEAEKRSVWSPPRGGLKRALLAKIIQMSVEPGGVGSEVLEGLSNVAT